MSAVTLSRRSTLSALAGGAVGLLVAAPRDAAPLLAATALAAPTVIRPRPGYDIILGAGQSNGRGAAMAAPGAWPPRYPADRNLSRILQVNEFRPGHIELRPGHVDPLNELPETNWLRVGPLVTFARRYAAEVLERRRKIIIVPAAVSGSSILQWQNEPVAFVPETPFSYFNRLIRWALWAYRLDGENRFVGTVIHNGETDCIWATQRRKVMPNADKFRRLEVDLVRRINARLGTEIPTTLGEMSRSWAPDETPEGRRMKDLFVSATKEAARRLPRTAFVQSGGLLSNYEAGRSPSVGEKIHFCAEAMIQMGSRDFDGWKTVA